MSRVKGKLPMAVDLADVSGESCVQSMLGLVERSISVTVLCT
jgi:hypothetical protein